MTKKEKIIKSLIKDKLIKEQVYYNVSPSISFSNKDLSKIQKKYGMYESELIEHIREYYENRKIHCSVALNVPYDEVEFKIGNEVIKPNKTRNGQRNS